MIWSFFEICACFSSGSECEHQFREVSIIASRNVSDKTKIFSQQNLEINVDRILLTKYGYYMDFSSYQPLILLVIAIYQLFH